MHLYRLPAFQNEETDQVKHSVILNIILFHYAMLCGMQILNHSSCTLQMWTIELFVYSDVANFLFLQGLPHAVGALGWIALEKERNYSKAAAYFEESYNTGHMDAGYYLGHMYQYGIYPNKSQDYVSTS